MSLFRSRQRSSALVAGVLLLAPLSACGFDYSTDQVYVASAGVDYREGPLDVLSAVVVSAADGSGTFIASFSNNTDSSEQIVAMSPGALDTTLEVAGFEPITVEPQALVSLAADPSITVSGDFIAGDYVPITIDLENADPIEMSIPVVAAVDEYEGLDISGSVTPADEASPTE